jgi:hypothetical protein
MFQKLFNISVVIFVALFSAIVLVFLIKGAVSLMSPSMMAESNGIFAVGGGVSWRLMMAVLLGALALLIAAVLVLLQRSRS